MDNIVIVTLITLLGNLIINLLQYRHINSQAKEKESVAASNLIERALQVSTEEVKSLRAINEDLREDIKQKQARIEALEKRVSFLEEEIERLKKL